MRLRVSEIQFKEDDFEAMTIGEYPEVENAAKWSVLFVQGANLYAKIANVGGNKMMHMHDNDAADYVTEVMVLDNPRSHSQSSPLDQVDFVIRPVTGANAVCRSGVMLRESESEWLYVRVNHVTGDVEYSFNGVN